MNAAHRRALETRRLYHFEAVFTRELPLPARRDRPIGYLRDLARQVWAKHGRRGLPPPAVVCGHGTKHNGSWFSYAIGYSRIELSRAQRTVAVLLHELTHTLGHGTHGRGFVRKYRELLVEYGGCDDSELRFAMSLFNVKG